MARASPSSTLGYIAHESPLRKIKTLLLEGSQSYSFEEYGDSMLETDIYYRHPVLSAGPGKFIKDRRHDPDSEAPEWVSECDRPTVWIELPRWDRELALTVNCLCREGLVEVDEVHNLDRERLRTAPRAWPESDLAS